MAYQNTQEIIWIARVFKLVTIGIFIWSIASLYHSAPKYYQEQKLIQSKLAETYGFSEEMAATVQCYKGYMHYPNSGVFSGLLAVTPSITCNVETLNQQKENRYALDYFSSISFLLISVLLLLVTQEKNRGSH